MIAYVTIRAKETPTAAVEETLGIVDNGLHDFGPVQALGALREMHVARTGKKGGEHVQSINWAEHSRTMIQR